MSLASFGRCSLTSTPGAEVLIGLNSPAPLLSGLRSKVSLWLGPPSIHRRMQLLCFLGATESAAAAWLARTDIQPDADATPTPAESLRNSRRERSVRLMGSMACEGVRVEGVRVKAHPPRRVGFRGQ